MLSLAKYMELTTQVTDTFKVYDKATRKLDWQEEFCLQKIAEISDKNTEQYWQGMLDGVRMAKRLLEV